MVALLAFWREIRVWRSAVFFCVMMDLLSPFLPSPLFLYDKFDSNEYVIAHQTQTRSTIEDGRCDRHKKMIDDAQQHNVCYHTTVSSYMIRNHLGTLSRRSQY